MLTSEIGVLLTPRESFKRERTPSLAKTFWIIAALLFASAALTLFYYSTADFDWLREQLLGRITPDRRAIAGKMISRDFLLYAGIFGALLRTATWLVVLGAYFSFVDRLRGGDRLYRDWLYFGALSCLPWLLLLPVGIVAVLVTPGHRVLPGELDTTSLSRLIGGLNGSRWKALCDNLSFIQIWPVILQAIGLDVWAGRDGRRVANWMVASGPMFAFYGVWAMWLLAVK